MQEIITRGKKNFTAENTFFHGRKISSQKQGNFPPNQSVNGCESGIEILMYLFQRYIVVSIVADIERNAGFYIFGNLPIQIPSRGQAVRVVVFEALFWSK
jgi:hypothetical protein